MNKIDGQIPDFNCTVKLFIKYFYFKMLLKILKSILDLIKGYPVNAQFFIRRIPFSQVPEDEEESAQFLHKMYQEKVFFTYFCTSLVNMPFKKNLNHRKIFRMKFMMYLKKQEVLLHWELKNLIYQKTEEICTYSYFGLLYY